MIGTSVMKELKSIQWSLYTCIKALPPGFHKKGHTYLLKHTCNWRLHVSLDMQELLVNSRSYRIKILSRPFHTLQENCLYLEFFWSECGKTQTRKTPNTYTFHAVIIYLWLYCKSLISRYFLMKIRALSFLLNFVFFITKCSSYFKLLFIVTPNTFTALIS